MPELDVTGRAVRRATEQILKIRTKIKEVVPLGPDKMSITPTEMKKSYDQMTPEERAALAASQGGIDMALEMVNNGNS